jgi:hypothetical protein
MRWRAEMRTLEFDIEVRRDAFRTGREARDQILSARMVQKTTVAE